MNIELITIVRNQTNIILKYIKLKPRIELRYYIKPNIIIDTKGNITKEKHCNNTGYYVYNKDIESIYPIGNRYLQVMEELLVRGLAYQYK